MMSIGVELIFIEFYTRIAEINNSIKAKKSGTNFQQQMSDIYIEDDAQEDEGNPAELQDFGNEFDDLDNDNSITKEKQVKVKPNKAEIAKINKELKETDQRERELVENDLLFTVQGVGSVKNVAKVDVYVKHESCESSLKDLIRQLKNESSVRPLVKQTLGKWSFL